MNIDTCQRQVRYFRMKISQQTLCNVLSVNSFHCSIVTSQVEISASNLKVRKLGWGWSSTTARHDWGLEFHLNHCQK
jgi:hypothetical protein